MTGAAYAAGLPAAASSTASAVLQRLGITAPGPNSHANTHPAATHGSTVSTLAKTTTAAGAAKGAVISAAASGGKSRAGRDGSGEPPARGKGGTDTSGHGKGGDFHPRPHDHGHRRCQGRCHLHGRQRREEPRRPAWWRGFRPRTWHRDRIWPQPFRRRRGSRPRLLTGARLCSRYNSSPIMAKRWQLRTWTKGTGAIVEPAGAADRPLTRARPGGLTRHPPKRPWSITAPRPKSRPPKPRLSGEARRRHALGYLDTASLERLEELETELEPRSRQ